MSFRSDVPSEPCPPTNISLQSSCDSDTVSVSWAASQGSLAYMAVAESREGHRVTCNTTQMTCDVSSLQCGQTYELSVFGVDGDCIGMRSEVRVIETGETSNRVKPSSVLCGLKQI